MSDTPPRTIVWLEPTTPGSLLVLDNPPRKPKWLAPGPAGTVLTMGSGGPTWAGGSGSLPWPLLAPDGSETAPSYAFASESGTGLFRGGSAALGVSINGQMCWFVDAGGVLMPGTTDNFDFGATDHRIWDIYLANSIWFEQSGGTAGEAQFGYTSSYGTGRGGLFIKDAKNNVYTFAPPTDTLAALRVATPSQDLELQVGPTSTGIASSVRLGLTVPNQNWVFAETGAFFPGTTSGGAAPDLGALGQEFRDLWLSRQVTFTAAAGAVTPPSGHVATYIKTDGKMYLKNSSGVETLVGTMDNPMTTAGDVIVGGTAGAPTRLGIGSANQVLTVVSGTPSWQTPASAGMTNPMTAAGDLIVGGSAGTPTRLASGSVGYALTVGPGGTTLGWTRLNPMTAAGDLIVGSTGGDPDRLASGSVGYVLTVLSSSTLGWTKATPMTTAGDLIIGVASGAPDRLGIGAPGQVLTVVSGAPAWATPAPAGMTNPMTSIGDLIVGSTAGAPSRLGVGQTGWVLTVQGGAGTGTPPSPGTVVTANTTNTNTPVTFSYTTGAGQTFLLVRVGSSATDALVTSVTFGGAALSKIIQLTGTQQTASLWGAFVAESTTANIVVTYTVTAGRNSTIAAEAYSGVISLGTPQAVASSAATSSLTFPETGVHQLAVDVLSMHSGDSTTPVPAGTAEYALFNDAGGVTKQRGSRGVNASTLSWSGLTHGNAQSVQCGVALIGVATGALPSTLAWQRTANPLTDIGDLIIGGPIGQQKRLGIGTTGQVLTVVAGSPAWAAAAMSNPMTTTGDVIVGGASGVPARLAIGATNQVLTVVGGTAAWAAAPSAVPSVRGLSGVVTAAGGTVALTADKASFTDGTVRTACSATLNIGTAGPAANGRDVAGNFNAQWVYVYWIWNPSTTTLATTASATTPGGGGPALPSGYTAWSFAMALRVGATNNQWAYTGQIRGSMFHYEVEQTLLSAGTATAETAVSTAAFVPPSAVAPRFIGKADITYTDAAAAPVTNFTIWRVTSGAGLFNAPVVNTQVANVAARHIVTLVYPNVGQNVYYLWSASTGTRAANLLIHSYQVENGG